MVDVDKIRAVVDADYEELCIGCFAHWVTALFCKYDGFTFEENKAAFFYLIERLLREGKVRFDLPLSDPRKSEFWEDAPEIILAHLKSGWPQNVTKENDKAITDFFYDSDRCPPISWRGEDGEWYGS